MPTTELSIENLEIEMKNMLHEFSTSSNQSDSTTVQIIKKMLRITELYKEYFELENEQLRHDLKHDFLAGIIRNLRDLVDQAVKKDLDRRFAEATRKEH